MSKLYDQLKIAARERRALIERQSARHSSLAPDARQHAPETRESLPASMRARLYAHRQAVAGAVLVTGALLGAALVPRAPVSANANVNATPTLRLDYELRTPIPPPREGEAAMTIQRPQAGGWSAPRPDGPLARALKRAEAHRASMQARGEVPDAAAGAGQAPALEQDIESLAREAREREQARQAEALALDRTRTASRHARRKRGASRGRAALAAAIAVAATAAAIALLLR